MAKKKAETKSLSIPKMTGKQLGAQFVVLLVLHVVVIYLANRWFPEQVVLGTHFFSPMMALLYTMVPFTLLTVLMTPVVEHVQEWTQMLFTPMQWMVTYFVVNFVGLWVLSRYAEMLGMGLSSWMVAAALAVVIDVLQGMAVMAVVNKVK